MAAATQGSIVEVLAELVRLGGAGDAIAELSEQQLAAIGCTWELWARPNQAIPPTIELSDPPLEGEDWPRWGRTRPGVRWRIGASIGPRGTGKTSPMVQLVHRMAMSMEWPTILLMAQSAIDAVKIFIKAANGFIKGVPPWERPRVQAGIGGEGLEITWPSGAVAFVASAGAKEQRGFEYHAAWCTELVAWPHASRLDAWKHVQASTRAGDGQILIDSTPRRGHPILEEIKKLAETDPGVWWVRHSQRDNVLNLRPGYYEDLGRQYAGSQFATEDLAGTEGVESGIARMADIEASRRKMPSQFQRQIVVLDPTGADPKKSPRLDTVGLQRWGLCLDDQLMPLEDRTARKDPDDYIAEAVAMYINHECDCLVIETDRGGTLPSRLVGHMARDIAPRAGESPERTGKLQELRDALNGTVWNVQDVGADFRTRYQHGTIYVREVHTWADRRTRADLLAQGYKQHRISHPFEVKLDTYETTITTHEFQPREQSPGDMDCATWAWVELHGLYAKLKMGSKGQAMLNQAARQQEVHGLARGRPVESIRPGMERRRDTRGRI